MNIKINDNMENGSTNSGPPIRGGGFRGRGGKFHANENNKSAKESILFKSYLIRNAAWWI